VTCESGGPQAGSVVYDGSVCSAPAGQPANEWFVSEGVADISCRLVYNRVSTTPCTTNGDCPEDDPDSPPSAPDPSDYSTCCSSSSSSSGSSSSSAGSSSSSGSGVTQSITVVTAFDPTTCTVTTQTLNFQNGLLVSVED